MEEKQVFDEEAFYGNVYRSYFLQGNNLKKLFDGICKNFLENNQSNYHDAFIHSEQKNFNEGELRVKIEYNNLDGRIDIDVMSFIGGRLLSDKERNLVRFVERITEENKFKLIKKDKNQF